MKLTLKLWIVQAVLLLGFNIFIWSNVIEVVKAENERNEVELKQLEYQSIDKHWNEMNHKMKEDGK